MPVVIGRTLMAILHGPFDPAASQPGVYSYVVNGTVCPSSQATVTVNVLQGPNAGTANGILLCSSDAAFLPIDSLLGTPDVGGTWTDPNGARSPGPSIRRPALSGNYTYPDPGQCGMPFRSGGAHGVHCPGGECRNGWQYRAVQQWTAAIALQHAGRCSPTLEGHGPTPPRRSIRRCWTQPPPCPAAMYTVVGTAPCPSDVAVVIVDVLTAPNAGGDSPWSCASWTPPLPMLSALAVCADAGRVWTDGEVRCSLGPFDPADDQPGEYVYFLAGQAPCANDQGGGLLCVFNSVEAGSSGSLLLCGNDDPFQLLDSLAGGPQTNGSWTAPDGSPFNGQFVPGAPAGHLHLYRGGNGPCPADVAELVDVIPVPDAGFEVVLSGGCAPTSAHFTPTYSGPGTYTWDLGNGTIFQGAQPDTVIYDLPGSYDVSLVVDAGNGCGADTSI